jgi:hypothetical protein
MSLEMGGLISFRKVEEIREFFDRHPQAWVSDHPLMTYRWYCVQAAHYRALFWIALFFTIITGPLGLFIAFIYIVQKNQWLADLQSEGIPTPKPMLRSIRKLTAIEQDEQDRSTVTGQDLALR